MPETNYDAIGQDILLAARNELYMSFPYLDAALCALQFEADSSITLSTATDGIVLYYDGRHLADRFLRGRTLPNRTFFHSLLHCMLRHLSKKRGKNERLWDLACDAAVESILNDLQKPCLDEGFVPAKAKFIGACQREMPVLTAEGIYRFLLRQDYAEPELLYLHRAFCVDDHSLWAPQQQNDRRKKQDDNWRDISEKVRTNLGTSFSTRATGSDGLSEQLAVAVRDDVDYRAFLRRFAAPHEVMEVDGDAFDYVYYTYGLQLFGNMPLIEPPETREERRIEDLVIAVDTSMSTNGELVRQFLACTYAILRSTETFTRKVNIRILQCDDRIRRDDVIRDLRELKDYMAQFELHGGSATDFRPVFAHVAELQSAGAFTRLRGLLYFTDGMGIFPQKRPPYDTAVITLSAAPLPIRLPPWAIHLSLTIPELETAAQEAAGLLPDDIDLDELPRT